MEKDQSWLKLNKVNGLHERAPALVVWRIWPKYKHGGKKLVLKKSFVVNKRQMSGSPLCERVLLYVWKVARVVIQKVQNVGSMAVWGEWATADRFQRFCVSLFDQASPGRREHSFNTSSPRTKQPLSSISHPQPASTPLTPGTISGRAQARSSAGGTPRRTLKRTGRSIKHTARHLSCGQTSQQWQAAAVATEMGENRVQRQRWQREGGVRHHGPLASEKPEQTGLRNTTPIYFVSALYT